MSDIIDGLRVIDLKIGTKKAHLFDLSRLNEKRDENTRLRDDIKAKDAHINALENIIKGSLNTNAIFMERIKELADNLNQTECAAKDAYDKLFGDFVERGVRIAELEGLLEQIVNEDWDKETTVREVYKMLVGHYPQFPREKGGAE